MTFRPTSPPPHGWNALADASAAGRTEVETVSCGEAWGRVSASPVAARWSSPPFRVAAMDGYACRCCDIGMDGATPRFTRVDTGDAVPDDADMVVMVEHARLDADRLVVEEPAVAGQHIRPVGEDILAGAPIVAAGRRLSPFDVAALAASGHATVRVRRRPRVAIIPTGDEIRPPGRALRPGEVDALTLGEGPQPLARKPLRKDRYELLYGSSGQQFRGLGEVPLKRLHAEDAVEFAVQRLRRVP